MRAFTALRFKDETNEKLIVLQKEVGFPDKKTKAIAKENLHLTLVFLGEISEEQAKTVCDFMKEQSFPKIVKLQPLELIRIGRNCLAVEFYPDPELQAYRNEQAKFFFDSGILKTSGSSFVPHITLFRKYGPYAEIPNLPRKRFDFEAFIDKPLLLQSVKESGRLKYVEVKM